MLKKGVNKFGTNIKSMISLIKEQLMVLYVVRVKKKKGKKEGVHKQRLKRVLKTDSVFNLFKKKNLILI
jgi:hypothetical protein